jgi:hypothetical protein
MRPRRTFAALLLGPCLVSACGGGGSSVADSPVSGTPTSSAPATQPPAHESPQHFIRRWADAEKRMENTGKTDAYLAMSRGCTSCRQLATDVSHFYAAGGYVKGGGWRIVSIRPYSNHGSRRAFAMRAHAGSTRYKKSASSELETLAGGDATDVVTLIRRTADWRVVGFSKLAS